MRVSEPAIRAAVRRGFLTRWGRGVYPALQAIDEPALVIAGIAAALAQNR